MYLNLPCNAFQTTLAGYIHFLLTGRKVLGVNDASGMFPVDSLAGTYDTRLTALFKEETGIDVATLFPSMLCWSLKAWVLSLAWLGLALGVSHFFKSGVKADGLAWVLLLLFTFVPNWLHWFGGRFAFLEILFPSTVKDSLWRSSFTPVATATAWLLMLGLCYLSAGYAYFSRRDAR